MPEPDGGAPADDDEDPELLVILSAQQWAVVVASLKQAVRWFDQMPDPRGITPIAHRAIREICEQLGIKE